MLKTYLPVPLNFYENVYVISSSLATQAELGNTGILDLVLVLCVRWVVVSTLVGLSQSPHSIHQRSVCTGLSHVYDPALL